MTELLTSPGWNDQQRTNFYYQMAAVQKDEVLGVLLAVFLGSFGAHHFYLRRTGLGILYLIFFWTGIPGLLGLVEAFFMPGRVRQYNAVQAAYLASMMGGTTVNVLNVNAPGLAVCPACKTPASADTRFCVKCGTALAV